MNKKLRWLVLENVLHATGPEESLSEEEIATIYFSVAMVSTLSPDYLQAVMRMMSISPSIDYINVARTLSDPDVYERQ